MRPGPRGDRRRAAGRTADRIARRTALVLAVATTALATTGCGARSAPGDDPAPAPSPAPNPAPWPNPPAEPTPAPPAPWSATALEDVPRAYRDAWSGAENRATCALLAFRPAGVDARATPRPASFSGGWGVAYDLPGLRSAFGVAGTGVEPGPDTYDDWPHRTRWADGSVAGYGPEGGSGPRQLAYLRVAGERCLYNVWSRLGVDHLERLLSELRFVEGGGAPRGR